MQRSRSCGAGWCFWRCLKCRPSTMLSPLHPAQSASPQVLRATFSHLEPSAAYGHLCSGFSCARGWLRPRVMCPPPTVSLHGPALYLYAGGDASVPAARGPSALASSGSVWQRTAESDAHGRARAQNRETRRCFGTTQPCTHSKLWRWAASTRFMGPFRGTPDAPPPVLHAVRPMPPPLFFMLCACASV